MKQKQAELTIPATFSMDISDVRHGNLYIHAGLLESNWNFATPYILVTVMDWYKPTGKLPWVADVRIAQTGEVRQIYADENNRVPLLPISLKIVFPPEGVVPNE